jgi:hypothetical protein
VIGVLALVVVAAVMMLTPVGAHVTSRFGHLWISHIKGKTDARYVQRYWAEVEYINTIAGPCPELERGVGVESVTESGPAGCEDGEVDIEFNRSVTRCAILVTPRDSGGVMSTYEKSSTPNNRTVTVHMFFFNGGETYRDFSVAALC